MAQRVPYMSSKDLLRDSYPCSRFGRFDLGDKQNPNPTYPLAGVAQSDVGHSGGLHDQWAAS